MLQRFRGRKSDDGPQVTDGSSVALIVGLGNPGRRYRLTRHNVGFMAAECFAGSLPEGTLRSRMQAELLETQRGGRRIVVAKPQTFMNASGESVRQLVRWYKVDLTQLLVIYDELDLPFGTLRLRAGGSAGGHNGVKSIIEQLGSQDFPRLRIGISRPPRGSTVPYVLSGFFEAERPQLPSILSRAVDSIDDWLDLGIDRAMNEHNRRPSTPENS